MKTATGALVAEGGGFWLPPFLTAADHGCPVYDPMALGLATPPTPLATVAIGLVFALALSGLVEGFVTPQTWPWQVKIALGAAALAVFLVYMLVVGRRAVRLGETGDLTEYEAGTPTLVAG